jgi:hypothetical protein
LLAMVTRCARQNFVDIMVENFWHSTSACNFSRHVVVTTRADRKSGTPRKIDNPRVPQKMASGPQKNGIPGGIPDGIPDGIPMASRGSRMASGRVPETSRKPPETPNLGVYGYLLNALHRFSISWRIPIGTPLKRGSWLADDPFWYSSRRAKIEARKWRNLHFFSLFFTFFHFFSLFWGSRTIG